MMRQRLWNLQQRWAPYLFVLPFVLLFCAFWLYPLGRSLMMSFYKSAGPRRQEFVGLGNYRFLVQDRMFWWATLNTILFTAAYLLVQIPLSLGLAMLLNRPGLRGRSFFRFAFFSTYMVGQVFTAVLFALLLSPRQGLLNRLLGTETLWLGDPKLSMLAMLPFCV